MNELKLIKNELRHLISGKSKQGKSNIIKTAQTYLRISGETSSQIEGEKYDRAKEERALIEFASQNNILIKGDNIGTYITEGAEQKVYFKEGYDHIFKKADAIFYASWLDYLNNLLLHNYFFPDTTYTLLGFSLQ
ncbi:MAG: hypothetical protein JST86_01190 [Bacteroidetes bacterium]|nr:hypothetical protein [Bacteroidota bacterium]